MHKMETKSQNKSYLSIIRPEKKSVFKQRQTSLLKEHSSEVINTNEKNKSTINVKVGVFLAPNS